jgi:hypothetical protein
MIIGSTTESICKEDIIKYISEADILGKYLGISSIPCVINSPFRRDNNPSFLLYSPDLKAVNYIDFGTGERGNCIHLLMKLWNLDRISVYKRIQKDLTKFNTIECKQIQSRKCTVSVLPHDTQLKCEIREWRKYDIEYWESYGISIEWLKYCEVYPIKHKIIIKNGREMSFGVDKYAYAFVERKEGKTTYKLYQPYNKCGRKWCNNHDRSVLGLWTKLPETGKAVCVCSSVKDAICLMANIQMPCICLQGEGYPISDTAIKELRKRFTDIYVCLDNDETGLRDAEKLAEKHQLINVVIPQFEGGKDISDYYKLYKQKSFRELFIQLFIQTRNNWYEKHT